MTHKKTGALADVASMESPCSTFSQPGLKQHPITSATTLLRHSNKFFILTGEFQTQFAFISIIHLSIERNVQQKLDEFQFRRFENSASSRDLAPSFLLYYSMDKLQEVITSAIEVVPET
jgi:hypothetical protein